MARPQHIPTLTIDFTPSLALYIWQSFRKGPCGAVPHYNVENVWVIAAKVCSTQGCIAASMANSSTFLPALLALDPLQTFPVDRLLYQNPGDSPEPSRLPQVDPLAHNLLLFAQLLVTVAAECNSIFANITATQDGKLVRSAIASRLQQLTDVSCCTPVLLTDPTTKGVRAAPQPSSKPSKRVILLRSAVLISKLATLTLNVKADSLGHDEPGISILVQTLWHSMAALAICILDTTDESAAGVSTRSGNARALLRLALANN